jgi:transcriptional regulator with XRE-family HTH domain
MGESKKKQKPFGEVLRETRIAKGFGLRKFAEMVGISPTYLSQVEQGKISPPTTERVTVMAKLLNTDSDAWIGLAGRTPEDVEAIIQKQPSELPQLLREASGLSVDQLKVIREQIRKLKEQGKKK